MIYGKVFLPEEYKTVMKEDTVAKSNINLYSVIYEEMYNRFELLKECTNNNKASLLEHDIELLREIGIKDIVNKIKKAIEALITLIGKLISKIKEILKKIFSKDTLTKTRNLPTNIKNKINQVRFKNESTLLTESKVTEEMLENSFNKIFQSNQFYEYLDLDLNQWLDIKHASNIINSTSKDFYDILNDPNKIASYSEMISKNNNIDNIANYSNFVADRSIACGSSVFKNKIYTKKIKKDGSIYTALRTTFEELQQEIISDSTKTKVCKLDEVEEISRKLSKKFEATEKYIDEILKLEEQNKKELKKISNLNSKMHEDIYFPLALDSEDKIEAGNAKMENFNVINRVTNTFILIFEVNQGYIKDIANLASVQSLSFKKVINNLDSLTKIN